MKIIQVAITFGVQYGRREGDERHPLGMYSDGYAVIEAPTREVARAIAFAVFGRQWSFDYDLDEFVAEPNHAQWHPAGKLLHIAWVQHDELADFLDAEDEAERSRDAGDFDAVADARDRLDDLVSSFTKGVVR